MKPRTEGLACEVPCAAQLAIDDRVLGIATS